MFIKQHAMLKINTWYRKSTNEWVGEIQIGSDLYDYNGTNRVTGSTEKEARNAAFAAIGHSLLQMTWTKEEN